MVPPAPALLAYGVCLLVLQPTIASVVSPKPATLHAKFLFTLRYAYLLIQSPACLFPESSSGALYWSRFEEGSVLSGYNSRWVMAHPGQAHAIRA
ncbi:hypothetical protein C8R44DRAFT_350447 [Mycena epipterygia]|nr:hypothetical protein C8R44DRAFT_350447 [Mycena epipterygia]